MKVRTKKAEAPKQFDNPRYWNSPIERMITNAMAEEQNYMFSRWDLESDTVVEPITWAEIVARTDTVDVPSVKATLLDDFYGEVLLESGKVVRYRFRKCSFSKKRFERVRKIARKGLTKIEPIAEWFAECDGVRVAEVLCFVPSSPLGDCTCYVPASFGDGTGFAEQVADAVNSAIAVVQDAILHRPRSVKREQSAAIELAPASFQPKAKSATTIRLGKTQVHIKSEKHFRWTQYWIVGSHDRQHEVNGVTKISHIGAYLKGPERESEEAKQFLACYLESEAANKTKITL